MNKILERTQWIALIAVIVLVIACFMPWVHVITPDLWLSGIDTTGSRYGKPAYNHFIFAGLVLIFTFVQRIFAKRINMFFGLINLAWAIRNFILFSRCEAGECPVRQWGIYLMLAMSIIILLTTLFPSIKLEDIQQKKSVT